ncbi:MAG: hypothetical protein ACRDZ8_15370 [Acidimicrobiales bacterium]
MAPHEPARPEESSALQQPLADGDGVLPSADELRGFVESKFKEQKVRAGRA